MKPVVAVIFLLVLIVGVAAGYLMSEYAFTPTTTTTTTTSTTTTSTTTISATEWLTETTTTRPLLARRLAEGKYIDAVVASVASALGQSASGVRETIAGNPAVAADLVAEAYGRCERLDAARDQRTLVVADLLDTASSEYVETLALAAAIEHLCPHHSDLLG